MVNQTLSTQYISKRDLVDLLRSLFGNDYKIQERSNAYIITVSRELTYSESFKESLASKDVIQVNYKGQEFLPPNVLASRMGEASLKEMIRESCIEEWTVEELCRTIQKHASITFAILVMIGVPEFIVRFIELDHFQDISIDHRLPLRLNQLQSRLGTARSAFEFYEAQWRFLAPVFGKGLLPRVLDDDTILPIVECQIEKAEGGYAVVDKIRIASSNFGFDLPSTSWFVQKRLRPIATVRSDFERELRNLSILKLLRHPCIIELLSCFMYRGEYHFIFPWADHGSLEDMLSGKHQNPFTSPERILLSIAGLCSAVSAVHDFAASDFEAIGCHHDIKSSNILIDGQKLLLSDFGLSRFKETSKDSASYFRGGRGDYVAPECEDLHYSYKKHEVRRSSDVWSLGCVILEILVFEQGGVEDLAFFRSERTFELDQITYSKFHRGAGSLNGAVKDKTQLLEMQAATYQSELATLVNGMLSLQPEKRPKMTEVCARVRLSLIGHIAFQIQDGFEVIRVKSVSEIISVEQKRFTSWHEIVKGAQTSTQPNIETIFVSGDHTSFDALITALQQMQDILSGVCGQGQEIVERDLRSIRKANDLLHQSLPIQFQHLVSEHFRLQVRRDLVQPQIEYIDNLQTLDKSKGREKDREHQNNNKNVSAGFSIMLSDLKEKVVHDHEWFHVGEYDGKQVIWETKAANQYVFVPGYAEELSARLSSVSRLMNSAHGLRVLTCKGYFGNDDDGKSKLGLVYSFPKPDLTLSAESAVVAASLHHIVASDPKGKNRPVLGDRFRLAATLARSLLNFHETGWVQRSICARNIVFFRPERRSWKAYIKEPYFFGFLHSREIEPGAFSEGDWTIDHNYQHPDYTSALGGFLSHYDYYNLGIVLIEIAFWSNISHLDHQLVRETPGPEGFRKSLLQNVLPKIGQKMGVIYEHAVKQCLTWTSSAIETEAGCSKEQCKRFEETVVAVLEKCNA